MKSIMSMKLQFIFCVSIFFCAVVHADIQCDSDTSSYGSKYCWSANSKDKIDDFLLRAYAYILNDKENDTCPPGKYIQLQRLKLNKFIEYSVIDCEAKLYCEGINSATACGNHTENWCSFIWSGTYLTEILKSSGLSSTGCEIPEAEELPKLTLSNTKASFNCDKAVSVVEKQICSTPALKMYDLYISFLYKKALENGVENVRESQRTWLKKARCNNEPEKYLPFCLEVSYKRRIFELESILNEQSPLNITRDYF